MKLDKEECKLCIVTLKFIPIVSAFLMLLHVITLLLGFKLFLSEMIVLTITTIMVLIWSHCFKFCLLHKLFSIYTILIMWLIYIHRFIGLGEYLEHLRISMLYLGIVLFIGLSIKLRIEYEDNKKTTSTDNR